MMHSKMTNSTFLTKRSKMTFIRRTCISLVPTWQRWDLTKALFYIDVDLDAKDRKEYVSVLKYYMDRGVAGKGYKQKGTIYLTGDGCRFGIIAWPRTTRLFSADTDGDLENDNDELAPVTEEEGEKRDVDSHQVDIPLPKEAVAADEHVAAEDAMQSAHSMEYKAPFVLFIETDNSSKNKGRKFILCVEDEDTFSSLVSTLEKVLRKPPTGTKLVAQIDMKVLL